MYRVISVTRRHLEFLYGEGDHQLPPTDDDKTGEDVE